MLLAFVRFLGMFENRYSVWNSFDIGFYLSLGSLFFFEMIYYVPIFWMGYFLYQQFNIKTLIASFMGCLTPYALVAGIFFLTDNLDTLIFSIVQNSMEYRFFCVDYYHSSHFICSLYRSVQQRQNQDKRYAFVCVFTTCFFYLFRIIFRRYLFV